MHSSLEGDYLTARKRELQRLMQSSEKSILEKVSAEVEIGLSRLKSSISEENFKRALQHGGACARQADNDQGVVDLNLMDLREALEIVLHDQTVDELANQSFTHHDQTRSG